MRTRGRVVAIAATIALAVSAVALLKQDHRRTFTSTPERSVDGKEIWYAAPADLAAASDLVLRGKVTDTGKGRTHMAGQGDEYTSRFVMLKIIEVLKGTSTAGATIRLQEEGWDQNGVGYVVNGFQWSKVGDEGYYFLSPLSGGTWGVRGSHGRILVAGRDLGVSGHDPDNEGPWKGKASQMKNPAVAAEFVRAALGSGRR